MANVTAPESNTAPQRIGGEEQSGARRPSGKGPDGESATNDLFVAESDRKSWTSIAFIRAGGMFSAPALMVGATLGMGLALSGAACAIALGFGFIVAYMCFVSMQASDLGLPTASLAASSLGETGSRYVVSLIVGIVTIGWFGVQTAVCGASLSLMLATVVAVDVPVWACSAALGTLMLATALIGFDGLKWISSIAAPFLVAVCLYGVGISLAEAGSLEPLLGYAPVAPEAIGMIAGMNLAVGLFAFAGTTSGDFARFARTRKDAVLSCVVGVLPAAFVALLAGAALAVLTGESDIAVIMNDIGLPAVGLLALVLSAWTVNAGNVYSAGLGFAVMLGRGEKGIKATTAVSGLVGIALAVAGILDQFQVFLTVLSACGPALAGTIVADYWIVRKGRPSNVRVVPGVSVPGVAALVAGVFAALVTGGTFALVPALSFLDVPFFVGPVNGLAVSLLVYAVVYRVSGQPAFDGPIAWRTPRERDEIRFAAADDAAGIDGEVRA